jgi:hypothetical protein
MLAPVMVARNMHVLHVMSIETAAACQRAVAAGVCFGVTRARPGPPTVSTAMPPDCTQWILAADDTPSLTCASIPENSYIYMTSATAGTTAVSTGKDRRLE